MTSFDMSETIAPKSDQLDAVDLLGGDRTFTIERISRNNDEQPFNFHFAGFPRPWRPGLSMRRVLMACWGKDAATYVGRRVTLYCDNNVEFGGAAVGGTRIRALSHIDKPKQVPLLIKRGKSAIFVVKPLAKEDVAATILPVDPPANSNAITRDQVTALGEAMTNGLELTDRDAKLQWLTEQLDRPIKSPTELSRDEGDRLLALIKTWTEPADEGQQEIGQ